MAAGRKNRRTKMAKRRKLFGAALAAHRRKMHSNPRRRRHHKRHARRSSVVVVNARRRHRRHHRGFSMNPIPRVGSLGKSTVDVAVLGGSLLAAMAATAWVTRQVESRVGFVNSSSTVNLISKAALAGGVVWASRFIVKNPTYRNVIAAGAFAPVLVDVLERFVPQVAAMVPVLSSTPMIAKSPAKSAAPSNVPARALQLGADLRARLNADLADDQSYIYGY